MGEAKPAGTGALVLAEGDNVAIATRALAAGETVQLAGQSVRLGNAVAIGHKFALRAIAPGERIVKYGVPIGEATRAIAPGESVHTQNVKSTYIASYTVER